MCPDLLPLLPNTTPPKIIYIRDDFIVAFVPVRRYIVKEYCFIVLIVCCCFLQDLVLLVQKEGFPNERFELVTNFPRRKLSCLDFGTTLKSAGLFPQETVFVQER